MSSQEIIGRPKYGMMTNPSRDIVSEIQSARRMGFDYVELEMEIPEGHHDILKNRKGEILKALKEFDKPPVGHTPYWSDLWSDYEEVRNAWIQVMRKSIDVSGLLGCGKVNIHAPILHGLYGQSRPHMKRAVGNFVRSMKELTEYASRKDIKIVLENMPTPDTITLKEYSYIMEGVSGLYAHIDAGHCFVEGGMRMISRYIRTFRDRLEHMHFSDSMGEQDDHIGIGVGVIDYYSVMKLLRRIRYDKTISLEIHSSRKELTESLKILRMMEEEIWPG
jgi:sugar phosphate isomerase/epimerase